MPQDDFYAEPPPSTMVVRRARALPISATPLYGRAKDLNDVPALFNRGARLVSLLGPGGVGKTRLALEVAAASESRFPGGVAFVSLASITNPLLVESAIRSAVPFLDHLDLLPGANVEGPSLAVIDNFEQVVGAAPAIAEMLQTVPGLHVLVTSRVRLNITGEHVYQVAPLELPGTAERGDPVELAAANSAVRLFLARAQASIPDFAISQENAQAVIELCRRVDGLPLAIELAAARVAVLTPSEMLARMEYRLPLLTGGPQDAPDRLRTMRAAISWSDQLLEPRERDVLRILSVFAGGFSFDAVEHVTRDATWIDTRRPGAHEVDSLDLLIANSLVQREATRGETRYRLLETIREYAANELYAGPHEQKARELHAAFYADLAERAGPHLKQPGGGVWMSRLMADEDNVRAAFEWYRVRGDRANALRIAAAMAQYWDYRGRLTEGRAWLESALEASAADATTPAHALARGWLGWLLMRQGDHVGATANTVLSADMWRKLDNPVRVAFMVNSLGAIAESARDDEGAIARHTDALAMFEALAHHAGVADALANLSDAMYRKHDNLRALEHATRVIDLANDHQMPFYAGVGHVAASQAALAAGDERNAVGAAERAFEVGLDLGFDACVADAMVNVAAIAISRGDAAGGITILGAARALLLGTGATRFLFDAQFQRAHAKAVSLTSPAAFERAWVAGLRADREAGIELTRVMIATELANRPRGTGAAALSPQEMRVLRLLADGRSDKEIAAELSITVRTANAYVGSVLMKLGVPSRTAAATFAVRQGLA